MKFCTATHHTVLNQSARSRARGTSAGTRDKLYSVQGTAKMRFSPSHKENVMPAFETSQRDAPIM